MVAVAQARPPFVRFVIDSVEDRDRSVAEGRTIMKERIIANVTPFGSKDIIQRVAEDWLRMLADETEAGRFPPEWLNAMQRKFDDFKAGRETPVEGTPLTEWAAITKAQVENCRSLNIQTIEQLADLNEEGMRRYGMGGRDLAQRARNYLASINDNSKLAERFSALEARQKGLESENKKLQEELAQARAIVAAAAAKPAA